MNRRTLLSCMLSGAVLSTKTGKPFSLKESHAESVLREIFPKHSTDYIRTQVTENAVSYSSFIGDSSIIITDDHPEWLPTNYLYKSIIIDGIEFQTVSWGEAALLVEEYLHQVSYYTEGEYEVYSADEWTVSTSDSEIIVEHGEYDEVVKDREHHSLNDEITHLLYLYNEDFRITHANFLDLVFKEGIVSTQVHDVGVISYDVQRNSETQTLPLRITEMNGRYTIRDELDFYRTDNLKKTITVFQEYPSQNSKIFDQLNIEQVI